MGTRSRIAIQRDDTFASIYCHWDGYLDGVGETLIKHYTDVDKIDRLIAKGDRSSLEAEITNGYRDDRGETGVDARIVKTLDGLLKDADDTGCEYVYVFVDGVWLATWHGEFRAFGMGPESGSSPWRNLIPVIDALAEQEGA